MSVLNAAAAQLSIGLARFDMTTRISFGIPHRVGACACEIGKGREDQGVIEMSETQTSWDNCVANKTRSPGNSIYAISYTDKLAGDGKNDDASALAASIVCWSGYSDLGETDPQIIIKARGDVAAGVNGSFPSIRITLRPLKTVLDYSYTGNANASGEGEIGFESQNPLQDVLSIKYFKGEQVIPNYYADGGQGQYDAINANYEQFNAVLVETGKTVTLNQTHYFKSADRPGTEPTPWTPLDGTEIDPVFNPRLPSMDAFDFKRDESFDFRYRFPSDYFQKYGGLILSEGKALAYPAYINQQTGIEEFPAITKGDWSWTLHQPDPANPNPINPEFQPDEDPSSYWSPEGVAPVIKGWYWDSPTPPTGVDGYYSIVQSTAFKMVKRIRTRYPFSFYAKQERSEYVRAVDHTEGQQYLTEISPGYLARYPMTYYGYLPQTQNSFKAIAWWRLEINGSLCDWNSKTVVSTDPETGQTNTVVTGITIKGYVRLSMKALEPSASKQNYYSNMYHAQTYFDDTVDLTGVTPSFIFRCKRELDGVNEYYQPIYTIPEYDAGTIPFEVTLDKTNAKGEPVKFLDFAITSGAELPGQAPGEAGSVPENSLVFIKDFVVTEVILP